MAPSEQEIQAVGREIAASLPHAIRHPVAAVDDRAMALAASDAQLKAALFRFVDVVPACRGLDDLAAHLQGFLGEVGEQAPSTDRALRAALRAAESRPGRVALGVAAATGVRHMAHRFIVGEDPAAAGPTLRRLWRSGVASSVDLLGESTVTAEEAEGYAARCDKALVTLAGAARTWPRRPALEEDSAGPIARANLSVKVSALTPLLRPQAPRRGRDDAAPRLRALLRRATQVGAHLHVDMESFDSREAVLELVLDLLAEPEFADGPSAGLVLQAYLRDAPALLERVLDWTTEHPRLPPLTVRLVKGAYWDHEVIEARRNGWAPPVFEEKAESDRTFEAMTRTLIDAGPVVRPAIASHNLRSVAHAVAAMRAAGRPDRDLELQVLRGLGDPLQTALAARGLRVRTYCPVGDLVAGMAYLVRRLLENSSNDSFLHDEAGGTSLETLLAAP